MESEEKILFQYSAPIKEFGKRRIYLFIFSSPLFFYTIYKVWSDYGLIYGLITGLVIIAFVIYESGLLFTEVNSAGNFELKITEEKIISITQIETELTKNFDLKISDLKSSKRIDAATSDAPTLLLTDSLKQKYYISNEYGAPVTQVELILYNILNKK